jgi:hypothetical protein
MKLRTVGMQRLTLNKQGNIPPCVFHGIHATNGMDHNMLCRTILIADISILEPEAM